MKLIRVVKKADLDDEEKFLRKVNDASKRFGSIYVDFDFEDDMVWENIYTNQEENTELDGSLKDAEKKLSNFEYFCSDLKKAITYAKKKKEQLNSEWENLL